MNKTLRQSFITFVLPLIFIVVFTILLATNYYTLYIYFIFGFILYLLTKFLGRELSFIFIILVLIFALEFTGDFFLLDIQNKNGLNPLKIHPLIFSWLIVCFLYFIEDLINKRIFVSKILILCVLVLSIFFGITYYYRGVSGLSLAVHNYLGPISFFLFLYCSKKIDLEKINKAVLVMISFSVIIGIMGIIEYITKFNIFDSVYSSNSTWLPSTAVGGYRIKTIIGHPLNNAIFFLFSMILVQMNIKDIKLKYTILFLFTVDTLLTGSRSIFLISFIVLFYNRHAFNGGWKTAKQYLITLSVLGITVLLTLNTSLGSTFLNRVANADGSTEARSLLIDYFIHHMLSFNMMGLGGASENIKIMGSFNTPIILEIPWIILFFEVGYFTLLYILLLIFILQKIEYKLLVIIFIIALSGYASFGVRSNANYFLFYLLTYGYILARERIKDLHSGSLKRESKNNPIIRIE